ncbi:hypothetical protein Taro_015865 [Colocasia esculenta]|uniref:Uncharacterized protein n=1 Tax=Colocasia esculenta TaxID=4460 RepID=A0A843UM10_COLES|nr:hypothetical protein [Colocasia esculenta]
MAAAAAAATLAHLPGGSPPAAPCQLRSAAGGACRPLWLPSVRCPRRGTGSRVVTAVAELSGELETTAISRRPIYAPTPDGRETRTPHSGYHFDGTTRVFFEGWYFKVSIPKCRQSFCFMYSMENPAFAKPLGPLEKAIHGSRFTGVGAQILGADDKYICQFSEESGNFWGKVELAVVQSKVQGTVLTWRPDNWLFWSELAETVKGGGECGSARRRMAGQGETDCQQGRGHGYGGSRRNALAGAGDDCSKILHVNKEVPPI